MHQQAFEDVGTNMCASLYAQGATAPLYQYTHIGTLTPKGPCFPGSADQTSSISGLAFYEGASGGSVDYPSKYDGALFFVDYSRDCLGAILPQGQRHPGSGPGRADRQRDRQPRRPGDGDPAATCTTSTTTAAAWCE